MRSKNNDEINDYNNIEEMDWYLNPDMSIDGSINHNKILLLFKILESNEDSLSEISNLSDNDSNENNINDILFDHKHKYDVSNAQMNDLLKLINKISLMNDGNKIVPDSLYKLNKELILLS